MYEKRGEQSNPVIEQQSSTSADVLFVTRPNYTGLAGRLPGNYSHQIASDLIEGGNMVSSNTYLAVITDDSSIVRKAAEKGIPFIFLERNPKSFHISMAERNPYSYCLDPTKKSFVTEFTLSVDEMLNSYKTEHETQEEKTIDQIKVLIVEDEPSNLLLYKQTFENQGYEVITAGNEKEATPIIQKGGIDAVITELKLPDSSSGGLHILQTTMRVNSTTPVIIHTSYSSERILSTVSRFGAYEVLTKSSDSHQKLVDLVEGALGIEKALEVEEALDPQPSKDGQSPTPLTDGTLDEYIRKIRARSSAKGPFSPTEVSHRFRLRFEDSCELEKLREKLRQNS